MAIVHEFKYFKPSSIDEAIGLLNEYGSKARILSGGTDLIVRIKDGFETPDAVIDIKGLDDLKILKFEDNKLIIGSLVTFNEIIDDETVKEKFPLLWESAKVVASMGIRNRATMVGNICSAVPSLDSGPALLLYEATVVVKGKDGERRIPIEEWFLGPRKTALKEGEIVEYIEVPLPDKKHGGCYIKLGRYNGEDLAQVGVGVLALSGNEYRVAFCAVGPKPNRARKIEELLKGKEITDSVIEDAKKLVEEEISPITDIRATKEYRMHMAKVMLDRALKAAVERLNGKGPAYGTRLI